MSLAVRNRFLSLFASLGRASIHSLYPDEFEYYGMMLELINSDGKIEDILVFPILPEDISINNLNITKVKKTEAGVVSLTSEAFVPIDINIAGNFGRKFRILVGQEVVGGAAFAFSRKGIKDREFSAQIKTGYGLTKILERIHKKSTSLDGAGLPYRLLFYNLAFNDIYLIESMSFRAHQSVQTNNMMWRYEMQFKAIADGRTIFDPSSSIKNLLRIDNQQKAIKAITRTFKEVAIVNRNQAIDSLWTQNENYIDIYTPI